MRSRLLLALAGFFALVATGVSRGAPGYGVYISTDRGASWKEPAHPFKGNRVNAISAEGVRVWAGTERGLFASRDGGKTWRDLGQSRLGNIQGIAIAGDVMTLGTKTGVWRAQKGNDFSEALELSGQHVRAITSDGERIFAGTDRGLVYGSNDKGVTWQKVGEGLPTGAQVFDLKVNAQGKLFVGLYSRGYFALEGERWRDLGAPFAFSILPIDDATLIAGANPGGVAWSGDGGKSWTQASGIATRAPTWFLFGERSELFVGVTGRSGLMRSFDQGKSWRLVGEKEFGNKAVVAMAAAGNVLIVATVNGAPSDAFDFGRIAGIAE
jgi:hypothetical protein